MTKAEFEKEVAAQTAEFIKGSISLELYQDYRANIMQRYIDSLEANEERLKSGIKKAAYVFECTQDISTTPRTSEEWEDWLLRETYLDEWEGKKATKEVDQ